MSMISRSIRGRDFVSGAGGKELKARTVVLATGIVDNEPPYESQKRRSPQRHSVLPDLRWLRSDGPQG